MIVCFTGHRPQSVGGFTIPNPTYDHICKEIKRVLKEVKPQKAISGMALGIDTWSAEICNELNIPWVAAIPFKGQEYIWPQESQSKYYQLLSLAAEIVIVSEGGYEPWKMQKRNEWMVDNADAVIGVWNGSPGGTANCMRYAHQQNKMIYRISPQPDLNSNNSAI